MLKVVTTTISKVQGMETLFLPRLKGLVRRIIKWENHIRAKRDKNKTIKMLRTGRMLLMSKKTKINILTVRITC